MKLKLNLLIPILENQPSTNKYSKAFLNLKNTFELEMENGYEFPKNMLDKFDKLEKKYLDFNNTIPLIVVEKYYQVNSQDLDSYIFLEYRGKEFQDNTKIIELFSELEEYFNNCFKLACQIVDLYNLEVKLNDKHENKSVSKFF